MSKTSTTSNYFDRPIIPVTVSLKTTAQKIREANTGKKRTALQRATMSAAQTGRVHSEETKAKISASRMGQSRSNPETQAKRLATYAAKRALDLTYGRHSAETRHKQSQTMKAYYAAHPELRVKLGRKKGEKPTLKQYEALCVGKMAAPVRSDSQTGYKGVDTRRQRGSVRYIARLKWQGFVWYGPKSHKTAEAAAHDYDSLCRLHLPTIRCAMNFAREGELSARPTNTEPISRQ